MAFKIPSRFAGDQAEQLETALANAQLQREKFRDSGPLTFDQGIASRDGSREFDQTGAHSDFGQAVDDPAARDYFNRFANGLIAFNDTFG
jgi:hypothetical protein